MNTIKGLTWILGITSIFVLFYIIIGSGEAPVTNYQDEVKISKSSIFKEEWENKVTEIKSNSVKNKVVYSNANVKTLSKYGFYVTKEFVELVAGWEGFLPQTAARDGGLDIGYGFHNQYYNGKEYIKVQWGMTMTKEEADLYLKYELEHLIDKAIDHFLIPNGWDPKDFNNNQILAITSYWYNRGYGSSKNPSNLLFLKSNSPTIKDIGNNFPKYWGSNASVKAGLINRRMYEKSLFFSTDFGTPA